MIQEKVVYITRKEVANLLKISIGTVDSYCKKGYLKPYGIGRRILFNQSEVNGALIEL